MKMNRLNFTRTTFGLLGLALLLLGACNTQTKKEVAPKMMTQSVDEVDAPEEIISLDEAKVLCENYENRRASQILEFEMAQSDGKEKFIPTQFVAFDLKTLKRYIKYVEQEARKAKVMPDSLRIYLGNYGNEGKEANHNTVFILPTAKVGNDYGGFYIGDNGQAELIRNYWPRGGENGDSENKSKASFVPSFSTSLMSGGSLVMNRGQSGPPPFGDF